MFKKVLFLFSEDQQNRDCSYFETHKFDCLKSPLTNGVYINHLKEVFTETGKTIVLLNPK